MKTTRPTAISWIVGTISVCALMVLGVAPAPAASFAKPAPSPWLKVGGAMKIDVPSGFGSFADIDSLRSGVQISVQVSRNASTHRIRFSSNAFVIGESADGGFTPQQPIGAGFRSFAWGRGATGTTVRLWTPAFDAAHSLVSLDPALPCTTPTGSTTPVAGPFTITIPSGAEPGGRTVPTPTTAFVYGDPAHPKVVIRNDGGIVLGTRSKGNPSPRGGFLFAETIFAYGIGSGIPKLWTPVFNLRSTELAETNFVACTAAPPGTITLTEHLVPQSDGGRFDLQVDGVTKAAGAGDQGSTGPVPLSNGEHAVAEVASSGTSLDDYTVGIVCTEDTNPASPLTSSVAGLNGIPVLAGDDWRCDVTSTRIDEIDFDSIDVGSTPDTTHASSKEIGPLGGSVEATSSDGTQYSLSISPGALAAPTSITLTPTAVTGLDEIADATPFAVEFAPSGLTFAFPALLTITPAPGAPSVDFAAIWEDGTPGVDVEFFTRGPAGSLVIEVPHFSGLASIQATQHKYDQDLKQAISNLPSYGGLNAQLANDFAGLPGTSAAVAADVQAIFDASVKPLLDHAGDSLLQLQLADRSLLDFGATLQSYDLFPYSIYDIQISAGPPAKTVTDLEVAAIGTFIDKADAFADSYMTVCDAPVTSLTEWFAVPFAVVSELSVRGITRPITYCAFARIETLDWSTHIDETQTAVDGRLQSVIDAPAQTPGGDLVDGRMLFPQQTAFDLDAADATWVSGGSNLNQQTGGDGLLDLHLQRLPGPQALTVDGTGQPFGLWAELSTIDPSIPATVPVHLKATTDALSVQFRSPPTDVVLPFGHTSHLCVDVKDRNNHVMVGTTVYWAADGPGSLQNFVSLTNNLGIACVDYDHPPGPVTQGDTVTIRANAVDGNDSGIDDVELVLQWAHIEIETRPETHGGYANTTNTAVHVNANEPVHIRISITRSGATPSDPPRPIDELDLLGAEIESGGGGALTDDEFPNEPPVPVSAVILLDADVNGRSDITWDPGSSTNDSTIRIMYPNTVFGTIPGVFATVTFTQQGLGNVDATFVGQGSCGDHFNWHLNLQLAASRQADGTVAFPTATGFYSLLNVNYQNAEGICGASPQFTVVSTGVVTGAFLSPSDSGMVLAVTLDVMETYCDGAGCTTSGPWPRGQGIPVQPILDASGNIIALDFRQNTTVHTGTHTFTTTATGYVSVS